MGATAGRPRLSAKEKALEDEHDERQHQQGHEIHEADSGADP
jgi:hypothetical protein